MCGGHWSGPGIGLATTLRKQLPTSFAVTEASGHACFAHLHPSCLCMHLARNGAEHRVTAQLVLSGNVSTLGDRGREDQPSVLSNGLSICHTCNERNRIGYSPAQRVWLGLWPSRMYLRCTVWIPCNVATWLLRLGCGDRRRRSERNDGESDGSHHTYSSDAKLGASLRAVCHPANAMDGCSGGCCSNAQAAGLLW